MQKCQFAMVATWAESSQWQVFFAVWARFGLIRQQMLLANKTYASIVDTISTDSEDITMPSLYQCSNISQAW